MLCSFCIIPKSDFRKCKLFVFKTRRKQWEEKGSSAFFFSEKKYFKQGLEEACFGISPYCFSGIHSYNKHRCLWNFRET